MVFCRCLCRWRRRLVAGKKKVWSFWFKRKLAFFYQCGGKINVYMERERGTRKKLCVTQKLSSYLLLFFLILWVFFLFFGHVATYNWRGRNPSRFVHVSIGLATISSSTHCQLRKNENPMSIFQYFVPIFPIFLILINT